MSATEKPLHVRVAEALGWKNVWLPDLDLATEIARATSAAYLHHAFRAYRKGEWIGDPPFDSDGAQVEVPHFDTDWAATGPPIEEFRISLSWTVGSRRWEARQDGSGVDDTWSDKALVAACTFLLALAEKGALKA